MCNLQIGPDLVFKNCFDVGAIDYYYIGYTSAWQYSERIKGRRPWSSKDCPLDASGATARHNIGRGFFKALVESASPAAGSLGNRIAVREIAWDSPKDIIAKYRFR